MTTPVIQTSFAAGEISPALYGHVDLAKYNVAATTLRNLFVSYKGGASSRAGTKYVITSLTPISQFAPPRIITFQFSLTQGYLLEIGFDPFVNAPYMAFYSNGSPVIEAEKNITGATQANPCVLNVPAHGYAPGDRVSVVGIIGMTPLNNRLFTVGVIDADNFYISMLNSAVVDSTAFPAYVAGGTVARLYKIAAPWALADLPSLKFTQSADVMSFTHPSYPPYDLTRLSGNNWTLIQTTFGTTQQPPAGDPAVVANVLPNPTSTPPTLPAAYAYVVTSVNAAGSESVASEIGECTNSVDMNVTAGSITITWNAAAGASYYNIYRAPTSFSTIPGDMHVALPVPAGAIFSFVGQTFGTQFVDSNIIPDTTQVPPLSRNPFAAGAVLSVFPASLGGGYTTATVTVSGGTGAVITPVIVGGQVTGYIVVNGGSGYTSLDTAVVSGDGAGAVASMLVGPTSGVYPGVVAYYQQRRIYASSSNAPDTYWMSKPAQFTNFDSGIPVQPDDAITGTPWSQQVNGIQWILPEPGGMMVMTGDGAWQVTGAGGSALNPVSITPASQQAVPQLFAGISATVRPIQIYSDILFVTAQGTSVRDITYNYFSNNWSGLDQTVLSSHLFTDEITHGAWCEEPYKIVWYTRCDGVLLSFSFLKEQEVYGWARHDTRGAFVDVTAVGEPPVNALYTLVQRTTPNGLFYYIERMDNRIWVTNEDPWCVDAGASYPMPSFTTPLFASSAFGPVTISSPFGVFTPSMVGSVLRISGGIVLLATYISAQQMSGTWFLSPSASVEAF